MKSKLERLADVQYEDFNSDWVVQALMCDPEQVQSIQPKSMKLMHRVQLHRRPLALETVKDLSLYWLDDLQS